MFKKIASLIMCLIITAGIFALPFSAAASSYRQKLLDEGFPETYVDSLVSLHSKYPKWNFKAFQTNLDWENAVDGERKKHSNQILLKTASRGDEYYCQCSDCKGTNHASEAAVKYYMDPRNWLSEKYIFQFESTKYSSKENQSGVESIIKSTWMKNSYITYNSTSSVSKTYKDSDGNKVKYSSAFLTAAKDSGMSAYYLASKVVQEVGASSPTTGGSCGTRVPFIGMYNYYSIGAYSTAMDGLQWASGFMKAKKTTTIYPEYDEEKKTVKGSASSVAAGTYMSYITKAGDYYKVKLYKEQNNSYTKDGETGYVLKEDCNTNYFTYGRPWTNPYKSIYYGAKFIANGYLDYQYTGYLQKFNVNPKSPSIHSHEYMTNADGASSEAAITYRAYSNASILDEEKTFFIPVFKNMPKEKCTVKEGGEEEPSNPVKGLTLESRTKTSLTFKWDKFSGATKYYVDIVNLTKSTSFGKTVTTNSATLNNLTPANEYAVRVRAYTSKDGWSDYSKTNIKHALPDKAQGLKVKSVADTSVTLRWSVMPGADGYYIYSYNPSKKQYSKIKTVSGGGTSSAKVSSIKSAAEHHFAIAAFTTDSKTKTGGKSAKVSATTKLKKVKLKSLTSPSKTKIKAKWSKASGGENGYEIIYARDKKFKKVVAKKFISTKKTASYTGKNFTKGVTYYVKVRTYKTVDKKKKYGSWSNIKSVKSK